MTRLFLSLYLFIALSLIILSAGLERVFFTQNTATLSNSQQAWLNTFTFYQDSPEALKALLTQAQFEVTFTQLEDITASDSIYEQLSDGCIINGFSKGVWQVYIPTKNSIVFDVKMLQPQDNTNEWWLYSGVFFVLLGVVIAIWIYPFWRDLRKLIKTTGDLHADGSLQIPTLPQRSPLFGIANALEALSLNVKSLLQNQRELSGAVTHEFRTPLARLKFALADDNDLTPKQLDAVRQDIDELDQLIQEMLDFTKLDVHQPELHIEDIPLVELCQQRICKFQSASEHNISVSGQPATLTADGHYIARALDNLLSNAVRHGHSKIEVKIEQTYSETLIHVDDDGLGIKDKHKTSVFNPFYRPDAARDREQGGAGLGLAIVQRIQHWHNGECTVGDSTLGGARFTLRYPNPKR